MGRRRTAAAGFWAAEPRVSYGGGEKGGGERERDRDGGGNKKFCLYKKKKEWEEECVVGTRRDTRLREPEKTKQRSWWGLGTGF